MRISLRPILLYTRLVRWNRMRDPSHVAVNRAMPMIYRREPNLGFSPDEINILRRKPMTCVSTSDSKGVGLDRHASALYI